MSSLQASQPKYFTHFACTHPPDNIKYAIADNRQGVVLQFGLGRGAISPHRKKPTRYKSRAYLFLTKPLSRCRVTPNALSVFWRDINVFNPTPLSCATQTQEYRAPRFTPMQYAHRTVSCPKRLSFYIGTPACRTAKCIHSDLWLLFNTAFIKWDLC